MFIKMFREQQVRVADPLRPNRRIFETRFSPTGAHDHAGYTADNEGWIEVPEEVGIEAIKYRGSKGERFFTPDQVDEEVVAGKIKDDDVEAVVKPSRGPTRVAPSPAA